jgi:hypothetical protein
MPRQTFRAAPRRSLCRARTVRSISALDLADRCVIRKLRCRFKLAHFVVFSASLNVTGKLAQRVVIRHRPPRSSLPCGRKPPAKAPKRRCYQRRSGAPYTWNRPTSTGARGSDPLWHCWRGEPCLAIQNQGYAASKWSQLEQQLISGDSAAHPSASDRGVSRLRMAVWLRMFNWVRSLLLRLQPELDQARECLMFARSRRGRPANLRGPA